jgi:hypothetical protein|tara:strand:+ start:207 stop:365 length:159 start_codon:yes stop_codon:yes gene_type:complete
MEEKDKENQINKTPSKMARLAWPKAKYGLIIAILIIIFVNIVYYKDFFLSFL